MTDQVSTLGLAVDTTSVKTAATDLNRFAVAGEGAATSATALEQAMAKTAPVVKSVAEQFNVLATEAGRVNSAQKLLQSVQEAQQTAAKGQYQAQQSFIAGLEAEVAAMGKTRAELLLVKAAQLGVTESATPLIQKLGETTKAHSGYSDGLKLNAYQAQQLGFQLNDLFVQIASGGSPMTALIQQGSQLSGTFGGIGNAVKATAGYVAGFINPVTVAIGAIGGLAYAYEKGAQEQREFQKTLILTGNVAGTTAAGLSAMAAAVSRSGAATQGRAAEVLNEMAKSGLVAASSLEAYTEAALRMEKVGGPAAEDTIKAFEDLGRAPLNAAQQLDRLTNAFSKSTLDQIRLLEQQGRTTEAAQVAQKAYADALEQRTPEMVKNLGYVEYAWLKVKNAASGAGDYIKNIGRPTTDADRLQELQLQLQQTEDYNRSTGNKDRSGEEELKAYITLLTEVIALEKGEAETSAESQKQKQASKVWDDANLQYLSTAQQMERALTAAKNEGAAAGKTQAEINARLAAIAQQFDPNSAIAKQIAGIENLKRAQNSLLSAYQDSESVLEENRQAGLIGDRNYFSAKLAFINLNIEAQKKLIQADIAEQQAQLKAPNLTTSDRESIKTRIKDDQQALLDLNSKAATQTTNLATEQTKSINAVAAAYEAAKFAAQDYLDSITKADNRTLAGLGQGNLLRSTQQGRDQISDKYADDLKRAEQQISQQRASQGGQATEEQQQQFDRQVQLIQDFKSRSLAEYDDYTTKRLALEAKWQTGAAEAMANYAADTANIAKQTEDLYTHAYSNMEDALVSFIKTGKLSFSSLADSIITDLVRIQVKQAIVSASSSSWGQSILQGIGYFIGGTGGAGGGGTGGGTGAGLNPSTSGWAAIGAPVGPNSTTQVNERDIPEIALVGGKQYLTTGSQGGKVTPLKDAGLGGPTININIGAGVQRSEIVALIPELKRQIKSEVMASLVRPGANYVRG